MHRPGSVHSLPIIVFIPGSTLKFLGLRKPLGWRKGHEAWTGSTEPCGRIQADTGVAKATSGPSMQGPSKLQGWKQGLASQKEHRYHSPMCQVGLQAPRTFQNRQICWSSGLPVGVSTLVQNPQCFPCVLAWALSWKPDPRTSSRTPSSNWNWRPKRVWSLGGPGLQEDSWKAPIPCLLVMLSSFWSYLGAC